MKNSKNALEHTHNTGVKSIEQSVAYIWIFVALQFFPLIELLHQNAEKLRLNVKQTKGIMKKMKKREKRRM